MLRLLYLLDRLFSGARYRVVRRFTRPGRVVLGALLMAVFLGIDTENTIAYQAFTVLLAVVFVAMCFSLRFRGRFAIERTLPRFGTVDQPIQYQVSVTNLARQPESGLVLLENLVDPRPPYREWRDVFMGKERQRSSFRFTLGRRRSPFKLARVKEAAIPGLPPGGDADVQVELTPLRRGVLRFTGATIARADPLGVFRSFARTAASQSTLILPRRYPLPAIALPGAMKYQEGGVALASNVGRSEEFVSLRDYRRGDPLRRIHWRSWAKTGKPIVKECEDEFFVRHALILDTFTDQWRSEVFEEAVSVAASFACTLLSQESLLDLLFVGAEAYCFTAGRGLAHVDQMLEILASVQACVDQPFRKLESAVLNHVGVVSGCICVFLVWDDERRELVRKLRLLDVPLLVLVVVSEEAVASMEPGPMHDAPDRFHVLRVWRIEEDLMKLS
jgi:uncharacterized protein (DUF58 family)